MPLTDRQTAVRTAIITLTQQTGYPPSVRELADRTRLSETRIRQHLDRLEALHVITREPGTSRGIRIVTHEH